MRSTTSLEICLGDFLGNGSDLVVSQADGMTEELLLVSGVGWEFVSHWRTESKKSLENEYCQVVL